MAGEIEEPFRINFQADLLHSGSISFGRFETESLSWERRSIFSHNRYLEEVEKYSKPGSVTEKKAYFEAEFRRKALLKQRSSESQNGGEFPTSRNNDLHGFEESGNGNKSPSSSNPSDYNIEIETRHHENRDVKALYENDNTGSHVGCLYEISHISGYDEDIITQEPEIQHCELLPVATPDEPVINMINCAVNVPMYVNLDETQLNETENVVKNTEESVGVDVATDAIDISHTCQEPKNDHESTFSGSQTTFSHKVKAASEKKLTRATLKNQANVDRFHKKLSNEASKGSIKPRTIESKGLLVKKPEKKTHRPASPFACSGVKSSKLENAMNTKEKEVQLQKSIVKDPRSEKAVKAQIPLSEKSLPAVRPTVNRSKPTVNSIKTHSAAGFGLKTDQRVENRKQFYTKNTERMHAKEAKVNQVEAKTLEKQAAEMKQFRRSLSFKAKPLPSFYLVSARGSDQPKVTPIQQRPSSQSMATRHDKDPFKTGVPSNIRRPSSSTSSNIKRPSSSKDPFKTGVPSNIKRPSSSTSSNIIKPSSSTSSNIKIPSSSTSSNVRRPGSSTSANIRRPSSSTSSTSRIHLSESVRRNHVPEKNGEEKKKGTDLKKQKEQEVNIGEKTCISNC